jgi:hypothetical protein
VRTVLVNSIRKMKGDGRDKTLEFCPDENNINEPYQFQVMFRDCTVPS